MDYFHLEVLQSILPFVFPFSVAFFQTIESTQKFLLDVDGPTSNMVCISDIQTEGRGTCSFPLFSRSLESKMGISFGVFDVLHKSSSKR